MNRASLLLPCALGASLLVAASVSTSCGDGAATCRVDGDCATGTCRDEVCVGGDPGDAAIDVVTPVCATVGASCSLDVDCCTNRCNVNRCADPGAPGGSSGRPGSSGGGSSSSGGSACVDLYGPCLVGSDCCTGLDCESSVCR